MAIKPADIRAAIENDDDFGHEMRVGDILRNLQPLSSSHYCPVACGPPEHGATYTDPITRKPRQFDFRYRLWRSVSPTNHSCQCVLLAVECKNLHPSSPLVVSGRERTTEEAYHTFVESTCDERGNAYDSIAKMTVGGSRIYSTDQFVGKKLSRLKPSKDPKAKQKLDVDTNQQSDVYDRWSQAVASAQDLAANARSYAKEHSAQRYRSFIMPVVAVPDESLWKATYDNTGKLVEDPVPVDEFRYFVATPFHDNNSNSPPWFILTNIHFVTITGLKNLLSNFTRPDGAIWNDMFPPSTKPLAVGQTVGT
jgi:hypothetical protein